VATDNAAQKGRRISLTTLTAIVALLTGGLALAAGTIGLLFDLRPDLRREPRERQFATLTVAAVERGVPQRGYLERSERMALYLERRGDAAGLCRLDLPGTLIYLQIGIEGFKGRETYLKYATYDSRTRRRRGPRGTGTSVTGEVTSERGVTLRWVRIPTRAGKYFIRWELYLAKRNADLLLAFADTPQIDIGAGLLRRKDAVDACVAGEESANG
jgi:hypothetical protein